MALKKGVVGVELEVNPKDKREKGQIMDICPSFSQVEKEVVGKNGD